MKSPYVLLGFKEDNGKIMWGYKHVFDKDGLIYGLAVSVEMDLSCMRDDISEGLVEAYIISMAQLVQLAEANC
jgi:hypothetical protein